MMLRRLFSTLFVGSIVSLLLSGCISGNQATAMPTIAQVVFTPTNGVLPTGTPVPQTPTISPSPVEPTTGTPPLSYEDALPMYRYDQSVPFDLKVASKQDKDGITIQDINYAAADPQYASSNDGRVEAYLVTPPGNGPFAGILFLHGLGQGWGNRKEFLDEAVSLAHQGVVSLLPSGLFPWVVSHQGTGPEDQINVIKQVDELRRSLDLLLAQPGLDSQRVAYVGHDYGAMHGAVMAGVDKRVKTYILMAGDINYSHWAIQYFVSPADVDTYRKQMAAVDPISYLPHAAPATLYFQFGKSDSFIDMDVANQIVEAASQPKKVDWYDGGHTLNDQATKDRFAWLKTELDLQPTLK